MIRTPFLLLLLTGSLGCGGAIETSDPNPNDKSAGTSGTRNDPKDGSRGGTGGGGLPKLPDGLFNGPPGAPTNSPPAGDEPIPTSLPPPAKVADPPVGTTPFHLVVTYTSSYESTLGLDVDIDGTRVVTGGFTTAAPYTFDFSIAPGKHVVAVHASPTTYSSSSKKTLDVDLSSGAAWGMLDLHTSRCDPCSPTSIAWELKDHAP